MKPTLHQCNSRVHLHFRPQTHLMFFPSCGYNKSVLLCFSLSFSLGSDVMPSLYSILCACLLLAWLPLVTTSTQRNRNRNLNRWQCFDHSSPGGYLGALGHMIEKKSFHQCMEMLERPVLEEEPQEFQTVENRKVSIIRTFQIASAAPIDIEDQIGQHSACRCFNTWRC